MGKILSKFDHGWPGTISRAVDDVVVSLKNAGNADIPFGAPVFLTDDGDGVVGFITNGSQTFQRFVGFAVRIPDKTPATYPTTQDMSTGLIQNQQSVWKPGEVIEVLVRGCIVVKAFAGFSAGGKVYIRKSDGMLVSSAGSEGSTLWLENVRIKRPQLGSGSSSEVVVTSRNIQ